MKAAAFDLVRPPDLAAATAALADGQTRPLAGGQSLAPMLNYRVVRPSALAQINRLPELTGYELSKEALTLGAAVTHAAIEDGRVPDIGLGILARVAARIAYRAVRNCGTIGGSLCHADPAADWVTVLTALNATLLIVSAAGRRAVLMADFIRGPYQTALRPDELLAAIRIPRLGAGTGWGYAKQCRKPGEFAHAMAAVLRDHDGRRRVVIGALGTRPLLVEPAESIDAVAAHIPGDPAAKHIATANLSQAWHMVLPE
jgi:carbon-monoxide dehydrogenase medium subunit